MLLAELLWRMIEVGYVAVNEDVRNKIKRSAMFLEVLTGSGVIHLPLVSRD